MNRYLFVGEQTSFITYKCQVSKAFKKEVTENMGTENMTKLCTGR
jgi:hypothetical protein